MCCIVLCCEVVVLCHVVLCCVKCVWGGGGEAIGGVFKIFVGASNWAPLSLDPLPPPSAGPPKILLFFFPLPLQFSLFCLSCWSFSLNFGGVFEDRDPQLCTFGLSGCTPAAPPDRAARDRTRQPENSKRAHLRVPALQKHHQNFTKKTEKRRKKEKNCGERAILGGSKERPRDGRSQEGRSRAHATQNTHKHTQTNTPNTLNHKSNSIWPNSVLAKVGHDLVSLLLRRPRRGALGIFWSNARTPHCILPCVCPPTFSRV